MKHPSAAELIKIVFSALWRQQCFKGEVCCMKSLYKDVLQTDFTSCVQQQTSSSLHNSTMASKFAQYDIPSKRLEYSNDVIRIVMVGKTGVGKSATGNTILGRQCFESDFSPESLTVDCDKIKGDVDGQKVAVIDTPGLFDTSIDKKTTQKNISQCIAFASPGPHIFLVIIRLGRYTEEEKNTVREIQKIFGVEADKYTMVLFTGGDLLKGKPIEEFVGKSKELQELVAKCNGQYHVFNNELSDRSQVRELLRKIKDITERNGGSHYTTEMFQAAEKAIEEEKQRILKKREEEIRKEQEKIKKEIEKEFAEKMSEVKDDMEKTKKLMADREREMEERVREMKRSEEERAREKAEKEPGFWGKLGRGVGDFLDGIFGS